MARGTDRQITSMTQRTHATQMGGEDREERRRWRRKKEEEGGVEGRCSGLTNSLICTSERKSSVLCCRVPEEGESVITQGERRGGRGRKRERCQGVTNRERTESGRT